MTTIPTIHHSHKVQPGCLVSLLQSIMLDVSRELFNCGVQSLVVDQSDILSQFSALHIGHCSFIKNCRLSAFHLFNHLPVAGIAKYSTAVGGYFVMGLLPISWLQFHSTGSSPIRVVTLVRKPKGTGFPAGTVHG